MAEWNEKDIAFIKKHVHTMSNEEIALKLGRSVPSVKGQLRVLKITRTKDTEIYSPIKGERWKKVNEMYSVSDRGRIRNDLTKVIRKANVNKFGYERVTLQGNKSYIVHILVAKAFLANPNNLPEVNHKDGVKTNNVYTNLEWCTEAYNLQHAAEMGLRNTLGEDSPLAKMTEQDAIKVCELLEQKLTSTAIMKQLGKPAISKTMIDKIRRGLRWKHISSRYSFVSKES